VSSYVDRRLFQYYFLFSAQKLFCRLFVFKRLTYREYISKSLYQTLGKRTMCTELFTSKQSSVVACEKVLHILVMRLTSVVTDVFVHDLIRSVRLCLLRVVGRGRPTISIPTLARLAVVVACEPFLIADVLAKMTVRPRTVLLTRHFTTYAYENCLTAAKTCATMTVEKRLK